jgi:uncharacterized membrane protein YgcG
MIAKVEGAGRTDSGTKADHPDRSSSTGPRRPRRRVLAAAACIVVVVAVLIVLALVPLEASASQSTVATTGQSCGSVVSQTCVIGTVITLGDARNSTLAGSWIANVTAGGIVVTINNGGSDQACALCADMLYTSVGPGGSASSGGSFSVSGFGPFHISIVPILAQSASTTVSTTLTTAVL